MLKKIVVSLTFTCFLFLLSSCNLERKVEDTTAEFDSTNPVTICFDLDSNFDNRHYSINDYLDFKYIGAGERESAVERLLSEMKEHNGPENVTYDFIEGQGETRDAALTRIRAELMAGAGPDVFVICHDQYSPNNLFKFVEKKMEENVFLSLDAYMEESQFMDVSRMNQTILNGGKNSSGQQMLIPLRYTFPTTVLPASKVQVDLSQTYTLNDMMQGTDLALTSALAGWRNEEGILSDYSSALGKKADYKKESLSFSQEEFHEFIEGLLVFNDKVNDEKLGDIVKGVARTDLWDFRLILSDQKWGSQPVTIVPLYNRQGGLTAKIMDYAAVNRNTNNPAGAFWIVDFISGEKQMQTTDFHMYLNSQGLPIYDELMQEETMLPYRKDVSTREKDPLKYIFFKEDDWQAVTAAKNAITSVDFPTEIDLEIDLLLNKIHYSTDKTQTGVMIDNCYKKITMLLGES